MASGNVGSLWVKLGITDNDLIKGLNKAQKDIQNFGNTLASFGGALTLGLTLPIAAVSAKMIKMGMDAIETDQMFSVVMGNMADDAQAWSQQMSKSLGLNQYALREQVATFNEMFGAMGVGQQNAYEMSKGMTSLAADIASFRNLSPEEAFQKLQAAISGEVEPLKRLGYVINETTVKEWALRNGMIQQGEELSETGKVVARYNLILESTKNAQNDLARTLDSPTNKIRTAKAQFQDAATTLGKSLVPIMDRLFIIFKGMAEQATKMADAFKKLDANTQNMIVGFGLALAAIGPVMMIVGNLIKLFGTLAPLYKTISLGIAGLSKTLAASGVAMGSFVATASVVIGIIVAFGLAIKHAWDTSPEFRKNIKTIQDSLVELGNSIGKLINHFKPFANAIKGLFGTLIDNVSNIFITISSIVANIIKLFKAMDKEDFNGVLNALGGLGKTFIDSFYKTFQSVLKMFNNFAQIIASIFGNAGVEAYNNFRDGLINNIKKIFQWLIDQYNGLAKKLKLPEIKWDLKINDPTKAATKKVQELTKPKIAEIKKPKTTTTYKPVTEDPAKVKKAKTQTQQETEAKKEAQTAADQERLISEDRIAAMKEGKAKELAELDYWFQQEKAQRMEQGVSTANLMQIYNNKKIAVEEKFADQVTEDRIAAMADGKEKELAELDFWFKQEEAKRIQNEQSTENLLIQYNNRKLAIEKDYQDKAKAIQDQYEGYKAQFTIDSTLYSDLQNITNELEKQRNEIKDNSDFTQEQKDNLMGLSKQYEKVIKNQSLLNSLMEKMAGFGESFANVFQNNFGNAVKSVTEGIQNIFNNIKAAKDDLKSLQQFQASKNILGMATAGLGMASAIFSIIGSIKNMFSNVEKQQEQLANNATKRQEQYAKLWETFGTTTKYANLAAWESLNQNTIKMLDFMTVSKQTANVMLGVRKTNTTIMQFISNYAKAQKKISITKFSDLFSELEIKALALYFNTTITDLTNKINNFAYANTLNITALKEGIKEIIAKAPELKQQLIDALGISASSFASSIDQAFNETDLTSFKSKLYDGVNETIRKAAIAAFMQGEVMKPLLNNLQEATYNALSDGIISAAELVNIKSVVAQMEMPMKNMYSLLESIGLGVAAKATETATTVSNSIVGSLASAFDAANLVEFGASIKKTVYDNIKSAFIESFMASAAIKPLMANLENIISGSLDNADISGTEWAKINNAINLVTAGLEPLYNKLDKLGVGFTDLNTAISETTSILNAPAGFNVAGYEKRFSNMSTLDAAGAMLSFNGNTFTIVANNPQDLFAELQKITTNNNITKTGSGITKSSQYATA